MATGRPSAPKEKEKLLHLLSEILEHEVWCRAEQRTELAHSLPEIAMGRELNFCFGGFSVTGSQTDTKTTH